MNQHEFEKKAIELREGRKYLSLEEEELENLKILLTYEMWRDGMDFGEATKFYEELDMTREGIINYLKEVFDYD